jgi:hypothetical protein
MYRVILAGAVTAFVVSGAVACGGAQQEEENNSPEYGEVVDLEGSWIALGYDCSTDFDAAQLIAVDVSGSQLVATKTVGDECVTSDMETLRAEWPEEVRVGMDIDAEVQTLVTTGASRTFEWQQTTIRVVSQDEFSVAGTLGQEDLRFLRSSTDDLDTVDVSGQWQAWGYTCTSNQRETQTLSFEDNGETIVATKVTGDDCIGAGEKTWEGTRSGASLDGEIFSNVGSDVATIEILARDFMLMTIPDDNPPSQFHLWRLP